VCVGVYGVMMVIGVFVEGWVVYVEFECMCFGDLFVVLFDDIDYWFLLWYLCCLVVFVLVLMVIMI